MNWYLNRRSSFLIAFRALTWIALIVSSILGLIYAIVPGSSTAVDMTTIYDFIPLFAILVSFFLVVKQLSGKANGKSWILDFVEMVLSLIILFLTVISFLCVRYGNLGSNPGDPVMFRVSAGCLSLLLTQAILIGMSQNQD